MASLIGNAACPILKLPPSMVYIDNVPPIILTLIVNNSTGNLPILILSQQEVVTYAHHSEIKTK